MEKKAAYYTAQNNLHAAIDENNKSRIRKEVDQLIQEGNTKSNRFWSIKNDEEKKNRESYNLITEEGEEITDPEKAKEYTAKYYEDLLQARESRPQYEEWTQKIKEKIKEIETELESKPPPPPVSTEEMKWVRSKLKRHKATSNDLIPNEAFIEATDEVEEIYRKALSRINKSMVIPEVWQESEIVTIYKGKGIKGKRSCERGISKSSNFGKVFERIHDRRIKPKVKITEAQAGGKKGSSTIDHLIVLGDLITSAKNQGKSIYITYLDVTKAYDKAWIEAIMYILHKEGLKDNHWTIVKRINENLTARIKTKHGLTRKIAIKDSLRQGGVLSVLCYGAQMDEINKEIEKLDLTMPIQGTDKKVGCLLWVDDVLLATTEAETQQQQLDTTNEISGRYHIEFGKDKSKTMTIGKDKSRREFKLGDMDIEYQEKYTYLGLVKNDKDTISDHIKKLKGLAECKYQKMVALMGNTAFQGIEMEVAIEYCKKCIMPIITTGCEAWAPTKSNYKELNRIMDNILKRLLKTARSTPREVLYMETGLADPETIIRTNRINYEYKIRKSDNETMKAIMNSDLKNGWAECNKAIKEETDTATIDWSQSKYIVKKEVKEKMKRHFKETLEKTAKEKSKVQTMIRKSQEWTPYTARVYMSKLNRTQTSQIFKARTRMLNIKDNMRGAYKENMTCRICNTVEVETQKHIFEECSKLHEQSDMKISDEELYTEDIETLIKTANKVTRIMEIIEKTKGTKGKKRKATGLPQKKAKKRRKTEKVENSKPRAQKGKKRKATGAPQLRQAKKKRKVDKPKMDETMREIVKKIMEQMRQNKQEETGNTQHHTPAQPLRCLQLQLQPPTQPT
jgi:hypothetical protein